VQLREEREKGRKTEGAVKGGKKRRKENRGCS
jgi:hypothetical protein